MVSGRGNGREGGVGLGLERSRRGAEALRAGGCKATHRFRSAREASQRPSCWRRLLRSKTPTAPSRPAPPRAEASAASAAEARVKRLMAEARGTRPLYKVNGGA